MSPSSITYRSFAIYLVIVLTLSESPISAFTIRRMRTTTLRPLDLAGEESALLEVKSDLSKLNNERDNNKYGQVKPIRKSINFLSPDKKLARRKNTITTVSPTNRRDELMPTDEKPIRDTETTTGFESTDTSYTKKYRIVNEVRASKDVKSLASELNDSDLVSNGNTSNNSRNGKYLSRNRAYKGNKTGNKTGNDKGIDDFKTTSFTAGTKTTRSETPTSDIPLEVISTTIVKENEMTTNMKDDSSTSETTYTDTSPSEASEMTVIDISEFTGTESTATDATRITDSMIDQSYKASTKNPLLKKYTVIERKKLISTTEPENETTGELDNAESVSSTITLENTVSVPLVPLESKHDPISNGKGINNNEDHVEVPLTTQQNTNVLESEIKSLSSTQALEKNTITTTSSVESKRAGYLDFSPKQSTVIDNIVTTGRSDDLTMYNETELLGSIFEIDTAEEVPEIKNSTIVESQSQLADDAINEELLKEEVLNNHVKNSKRLEEQHNLDKVKPLDQSDATDDSLSVKPIAQGKGSLYAVSGNYRKMKKIEVQPSKPFVRDPDDNSWRNESLTSLGIVFKAKNASKPFTQVLRNKTEAELSTLIQTERDNNNEVPDLRQRLEKIAEVRKSKKKKIDKFGDTVYSDYEETSGEMSSTPKTDTVSIPIMEVEGELFFVPSTTTSPVTQATLRTPTPDVYMYKEETVATKKPKKTNKFHEYYDTTDEYDADYLNLAKIDLKKFTTRLFANDEITKITTTTTISPVLTPFTKQVKPAPLRDRKPTIQYFPPREQPLQKVNLNDYDSDFQRKVNMYAQQKPPIKDTYPVTHGTPPPATVISEKPIQHMPNVIPQFPPYKTGNLDKNIYVTFPPHTAEHANRYPASNDESFNRASYVIKHYKDLINEAVKDDYDKTGEFLPAFTEPPLVGITMTRDRDQGRAKHLDADYDYEANFRKDVLSRFVDNFNQNSERFKVDFPILYNNTVVHMKAQENGKVVASSSAFMKRLYGDAQRAKGCAPHCDMKVELSPAYELHYYVPDQEEKEEAELRPATLPFNYRL